jgi:probable phosphomutase (TIGR03848 family)
VATFYLIRHATNNYVGHTLTGWLPNVHLNAEGQKQARALPDKLAHVRFDRIVSSPLERAQETALPLAKYHGLQIQTEPAFIEVNCGDWTGKRIAELSADLLWKQWNAFRSSTRIPNGETMLEIQTRAVGALLNLHQEFPDKTIAIISHGDIIRALLLHFLQMPLDAIHRLEISPASWSIVRLFETSAQVLTMNAAQR